jgi:hypothetical protein
MSGLIVVAVLVTLACVAPRYGADSRNRCGAGDHPAVWPAQRRTPGSDVRALARLARRLLGAAGRGIAHAWREQRRANEAMLRVQRPWLAERERGELRWCRYGRRWHLEGSLLPSERHPGH